MITRPKLEIPRTPLENVLEIAGALGIIFIFYMLWRYWGILPARIPTHYNFAGQADSWGGKGTLVILPIVAFFLFAMMTVLQRFPRIYNYPFPITEANARSQYTLARLLLAWLGFEIVWFFAYLEWMTIRIGLGNGKGPGPEAILIFLLMNFATIGIYFRLAYKAK